MIHAEGVVAVWKPTFAAKAVYASKLELVAQPRLVERVIQITARPVTPKAGIPRIGEHG